MNIDVKNCKECVFADSDDIGYLSSCNLAFEVNENYIDLSGMDNPNFKEFVRHKDCPLNSGLIVTVKAENK